jgi:formylglycine-generating enzyme required for sulfatase activity
MQFIPAGMFQMGASDIPAAVPLHGVQLSAFCMDTTEVTVSAYASCPRATCTTPDAVGNCNWEVAGREQYPLNCVDWNQARAYCQSRGGDLPTEAQWEYAARGTDGRLYPWGNDAPGSQLCWSGGGTVQLRPCNVRSFPSGNSPFGLFDMAGNVWEWTLDYSAPYTGSVASYVLNPTGPASGSTRVYRGGSWSHGAAVNVRASVRYDLAPTSRNDSVGFRCARGAL